MKAKIGDRIRLISMGDDDPCPIEPGTCGTVHHLFDATGKWPEPWQQIGVVWDNGRRLSLVVPPDKYEVIEE